MKHIKTIKITVIVLLFLFSSKIYAQNSQAKEKIESLKIAFITEKLDLSEKEAKDFWPLYQTYSKEKRAIMPRAKKANNMNLDSLTDQELEKIIDNKLNAEKKILVLKENYYNKLKTVLPIKKIVMLSGVEKEFRAEVLRRLRDKRN